MAKGTIFHITTRVGDLNKYQAEAFNNCLYLDDKKEIINQSEEDSELAMEQLKAILKSVTNVQGISNILDSAFSFTTSDMKTLSDKKNRYFRQQYQEFQKQAHQITLQAFASDSDDQRLLKQLITNETNNWALFQDAANKSVHLYTINDFIRKLNPNEIYYVSSNTLRIE